MTVNGSIDVNIVTAGSCTATGNAPTEIQYSGNIIEFDNPIAAVLAPSTEFCANFQVLDAGHNSEYPLRTGSMRFATLSTVPTAPQNLAALPGNGRVTLTWDAPESDGGRTIDSYDYRYRVTSETNWGAWAEVPDSGPGEANHSRYRVMGLTNGTVYTFEVRAVNGIESGPVAGASGMPREPGAIRATLAIAPASPVAENVGTVTVTVTAANNAPTPLEAPVELSLATANGTATAGEDYVALSQTVSFAIADFALVTGGTHYEASSNVTLTITDDDVDEGDETFTIVLEPSGDSAGSVSRPPDLIVTIAEDDEAPGAPTLTAEPGDVEVTLKWTAPASAGTSTIDGYDYRVSDDSAAPLRLGPRLDRHRRRGERDELHRDHARQRGARQRHGLHLRGAGPERGRRGRGGASIDQTGRGVRAHEADCGRDCGQGVGERVRGRDDDAPGGDHRTGQDGHIHPHTEKRGLRGPDLHDHAQLVRQRNQQRGGRCLCGADQPRISKSEGELFPEQNSAWGTFLRADETQHTRVEQLKPDDTTSNTVLGALGA